MLNSDQTPEQHRPAHLWKPGQSGNPGGRPKSIYTLATLAQTYTEEALDALVAIMRSSQSDAARCKAVDIILDRGYGKAAQIIQFEGDADGSAQLNTLEVARKVAFLLAVAARELKQSEAIEHKPGNGNAGV